MAKYVKCKTCRQMVEVTFPLAECPQGNAERHESHTIPLQALLFLSPFWRRHAPGKEV